MKRMVVLAVLVVSAAACAGEGTEQPAAEVTTGSPASVSGQRPADVAALRDYELTMDRMDRIFAAQLNLVNAIASLSPAERQAMEAASATSPTDGLDEVIAKLDANAVASKAVTDAGLTTRDYITGSMAMMQATMVYSVVQTNPAANQDSAALSMDTNPANVRFVRDNMAELTRKQEAMSAEMSRRGLTGSPQ